MRWCAGLLVVLLAACGAETVGDAGSPGPGTTVGQGEDDVGGPLHRPPSGGSTTSGPLPVVLAHGMGGFERLGPIDYFHGVKNALAAAGHQAYFSVVDPLNTTEVRGAELLRFVEGVVQRSGRGKVHLVGHSQGGFDVRWVASRRPDLVASVTSISTPHRGTAVADVGLGLMPGNSREVLGALGNLYGMAMGFHSDLAAQLELLTTSGAAAFNARTPDVVSVRYLSIAGRTRLAAGGAECAADGGAPDFIARYAQTIDPTDPVLYIPAALMDTQEVAHDGLVGVPSARWGRFLGCIPADHTDEICQIADDSPGLGNRFDCHRFYVELVTFLNAGR